MKSPTAAPAHKSPPPQPEHISGPLARVLDAVLAEKEPLCVRCWASLRAAGSMLCASCQWRGE